MSATQSSSTASATPPALESWAALLDLALAEDVGPGDLTSEIVVDPDREGRARIEARQSLTVCGLAMAREVFRRVDPTLALYEVDGLEDGAQVAPGQPLLRIHGRYASILTAERTALNFMGRLCGIATQSQRLVNLVAGSKVDLVDTRKTTPGWRLLEKYAVAVGGGLNHRIGLYDALLVKDNHIAAADGLDDAVERAVRGAPPGVPVQIEVESEAMADRAIELGCRFLLLDNMAPAMVRRIVEQHHQNVLLEASGGIHEGNLREYAETGVARISMGALTHSVISSDIALEIDLLDRAGAEVS